MSCALVIHIYVCLTIVSRRHFVAVTRYAIVAVFVWSFKGLAIWQLVCDHSSEEVLVNFHAYKIAQFG